MPTKLKISNAAADPKRWDSTFKTKVEEAGDPNFFTQQIFSKWWLKGLSKVFLPPLGADLELTIDGEGKKFSWLIKPKDAKAGSAFFAEHTDLKAVVTHHGIVSGVSSGQAGGEKEAEETTPEAKQGAPTGPVVNPKIEPEKTEDPAKKMEATYNSLLTALEQAYNTSDDADRTLLNAMQKKVQDAKDKKVLDTAPMKALVVNGLAKVKKDMAERRKDPAFGVTPPNAAELTADREKAEAKFRDSQREAQKAAGRRKEEAAAEAAAANPTATEPTVDPNRWVPTTRDLPLWGRLDAAQQESVRGKLAEYNEGGRRGHAHVGVGGVTTLDLTGPTWGTARRGEWRLQINVGGRTLNIVDHAGKTWG